MARQRFSGRFLVRLGAWASLFVVAVAFGLLVQGAKLGRDLDGIVLGATRYLSWVALAPLALIMANAPALRDRRDGVEALALLRGYGRRDLVRARTMAALIECMRRVGLPSLLLCLSTIFWRPISEVLSQAIGLATFAFVTGVLIGGLAINCGHRAGARGRSVFTVVVLLPWFLQEMVAGPPWSIPGLLDAGLILLAGRGGA